MEKLDALAEAYTKEFAYSFDNEIMLPAYAQRVTEWLAPDLRVLDYGLGHGHVAQVFGSHFASHTIVEGSAAVIALAGSRISDSKIEHAMFEDFIRPGEFDAAVLGFVLEHVDDPEHVLRVAAENTRSGNVIVAVPNCESLHRRIGQAAGLLEDLKSLSDADLELGHQRYFSLATIRDLLLSSGFVIEDAEGIFLKPLTSAQLQALELSDGVLSALCTVGRFFPELSNGLLIRAKHRLL